MFSLPKKLSSPFGLLGDDAKLAFRTQPSGVAKLADVRNISENDDTYWSQYAILFDSASDVFSFISPNDIRRALTEAPENVATLIRVLCKRLFNLISDHTFPSPPPSSIGITNLTSWASSERNPTKEVLNCLRVLGRVLPVVFEAEDGTFEQNVLWKKEVAPASPSAGAATEEPQFVIEEEEDGADSGASRPQGGEATQQPQKELPCLAERLFDTVIDLMFCCGFTLPTKIQVEYHKINYVIWEKGVGSTSDISSTSFLDANKTEVLRFLTILLSRTMYHTPSQILTLPNPYTAHLVHSIPRRLVLSVLCSLLNTAMNSGVTAAEGWGGVVEKTPYNHLILSKLGDEGKVGLVGVCLGVLCVLLDYQAADARDVVTASLDGALVDGAPTAHTNAFRYFLAKLHRPADFDFIITGVLAILYQSLAASNSLLPGSKKPVPYVLDTFVFLWRMIDVNKKFRAHLAESDKLCDTLAYLLCFALEHKDKPQHHGLCRAISYIIQSLSAEKEFGAKMALTIPTRISIPGKWVQPGNLGDFMVTSIYSIVATTSGALNSLYPALLIALSNAAPYFKNLSVKASTRLVQLFSAFSNPTFLLADEGHPRHVFFMLEVFNGILYHQVSSNPRLVYAILQSHKAFEDLGTFTLAKGLQEVRRLQRAKEDKENGKTPRTDEKQRGSGETGEDDGLLADPEHSQVLQGSNESATTPTSPTTEEPTSRTSGEQLEGPKKMSDKARGKMRERSSSTDLDTLADRIAAVGIGRNGFVPTQEWVTSWQAGLPLDPVLLTISELLPKVQELQLSINRPTTSPAVVEFLQSVTLQHVLPPAPPLNARRFQWSDASLMWLSSLIWGEIYVRGTAPLGIWNSTNVRLFGVRHSPQPRGVGETVSNVVGGLWGGGGIASPTSTLSRRSSIRQ